MALLAAWNFDEASGTTATDYSGGARHANLLDNAAYRAAGIYGTGSVHRGATLVGGSSGVAATAFQGASFSFSYWALYAGSGDSNLVQFRGTGDVAGPGPRITAAGAVEGRWIDSAAANNALTWTPPGGWSWAAAHHFVFSYDKTTGKRQLWVDGVLRIDSALAGAPTLRPATALVVDGHVIGTRIDDLRVYSHALTEAEVTADMTNRVGAAPAAPVVPGANTAGLTAPVERAGKPIQKRTFRHGGKWAGILPTPTGHRLYPDLEAPEAGLVVDTRQAARVTTATAPGWLGVARQHPTNTRFSSYTDAMAPLVVDAAIPLPAAEADSSPLVLHRSPNGYLWAAMVSGGAVRVSRSTDLGATWSAVEVLTTFTGPLTGLVSVVTSGTTVVLVASGNDGAGRAARSISQDAPAIAAASWTVESLPDLPVGATSDDHLDVAVAPDGRVLAVAKTTNGGQDILLLYMLARTTAGVWTMHTVENDPDDQGAGTSKPGYSRPGLVVDGTKVRVFYGSIYAPQALWETQAALSNLDVWTDRVVVFPGPDYSDSAMLPSSADVALGGGTFPVLAHNRASAAVSITWLPSAAPAAPIVSRPIVGDPRADSLTVSVRCIGAASVRVKLATNAAMTEGVIYGTSVEPGVGGRAQSVVAGLRSLTDYFAAAEVTSGVGTITTTPQIARGRTLPAPGIPASFTVAFGSCFDTLDESLAGSVNSAFGRILARRPDLFLHVGDWTYADNVTALIASHLADHEASVDASTALQALLAEVPTIALPSDHDQGGGNNAGVGPWSTPNRLARLAMIPHPHRPNPDGLYTSVVVGRVRFIFLDTRYLVTGSSRLGAAQLAWVKEELLQPEPLKVLVQEGTWIDNRPGVPGDDSWPASPDDRDDLAAFIRSHDVGQLVGIGGDQHAISADDGSHNPWGGFPTFCAAAFRGRSSHKVANPLVTWNRGIHPTATNVEIAQYAMMHVTDNGKSLAVRIDGHDSDDVVRVTLDVNVDTRKASVTWWDGTADKAVTALPSRWDGAAERPVSAFWSGTSALPCVIGDPVLPGPVGPLVAHWDFDDLTEPPDVTYDRQARRPLTLSGFSRTTTDTGWGLAAVDVDALGETPPAAIDLTTDVLSVSARVTLSRQLAGVELLDANDVVVARLEARMSLVSGSNYRPAPRFTVTASGSSATSTQTMSRESATYARLVGVYDGQTVRAYINGGLVRSVPLVGVAAPVRRIRINLGASAEAVVDDVRVYSKALTIAEITEINALMLAAQGGTA